MCLLTGFATSGVIIDVEDTRRVEVEGASGALDFSVRRSMRVFFFAGVPADDEDPRRDEAEGVTCSGACVPPRFSLR